LNKDEIFQTHESPFDNQESK